MTDAADDLRSDMKTGSYNPLALRFAPEDGRLRPADRQALAQTMDGSVHDENGHVYDIEMQCTNGSEGELPKRTRYYQGMIDMDELKKGQYYTELKESFIIFICTFDPFGENLPMYTFRHRCIEKEGLELGDLSTKIFLNAKGESDTLDPDIAAFLRYVDGKAAEGALTKEINEEVIRIKEHKEMRREYMTLLMELQKYKIEVEPV